MKSLTVLLSACSALLLLAIPTWWPYSFYTLLRWAICGASIYVAWHAFERKQVAWTIAFAAIALLFNPIAPVYLAKSTWVVIDLATAAVFLIALALPRQAGEASHK